MPLKKHPSEGEISLLASESKNRLLTALSGRTRDRLWPSLERVETKREQVLGNPDKTIENIFFVERGIVSLVKTMNDGQTVEVAAIGIEGCTDPSGIFSDASLIESMVQIPGQALRIARDDLRRQMDENPELRRLMQRYLGVAVNQIAQTAACNCLHPLEQRCCRWLLIAHDSALADKFPLTQEFLAMMLGVTRTSVSLIARVLQRAGIVRYSRGEVFIEDRKALEEHACECYGTIRAAVDALFAFNAAM